MASKMHIGTDARRPDDAPGRGIRATVDRVNAAGNAAIALQVRAMSANGGIVVDVRNGRSTVAARLTISRER